MTSAPRNSVLAEDIQRYVLYKRALGRKYDTEEAALCLLDRYLCHQLISDLTTVTPEVIEAFLASRRRGPARSHNHLLGVIRGFFRWLVVQERLEHSPVRIGPRRAGPRRQPFCFARRWPNISWRSRPHFQTARGGLIADLPIASSSR